MFLMKGVLVYLYKPNLLWVYFMTETKSSLEKTVLQAYIALEKEYEDPLFPLAHISDSPVIGLTCLVHTVSQAKLQDSWAIIGILNFVPQSLDAFLIVVFWRIVLKLLLKEKRNRKGTEKFHVH